jgi:hypothetical protein
MFARKELEPGISDMKMMPFKQYPNSETPTGEIFD